MPTTQEKHGVLNETTMTVHRQADGSPDPLVSTCGHTHHLDQSQLRIVAVDQVVERRTVQKCGNCFDTAESGY